MVKSIKGIETEITKRVSRVITKCSNKDKMLKAVERLFTEGELSETLDLVSGIFKSLLERTQQTAARSKEQRNTKI